jgi:hypothetical protein
MTAVKELRPRVIKEQKLVKDAFGKYVNSNDIHISTLVNCLMVRLNACAFRSTAIESKILFIKMKLSGIYCSV